MYHVNMDTVNRSDLKDLLKNIPVFNGLTDEECEHIIPLLQLEVQPADALIIKEGEHGESMSIIIEGMVKVFRWSKAGEEVLFGYLRAGSFFGELSLIDNLPRSANCMTVQPTRIFRLEKAHFDKLLEDNPHIANIFYKNCLNETFSRFRNIASNFTFSQHSLREKSAILEELNRDLVTAKRVQSYFIDIDHLDSVLPFLGPVRHSYVYKPCLEVGGDFINIVDLGDDQFGVIIADVVGHGITASLATGVLKSAFSIYVQEFGTQPAKLMKQLNSHFFQVMPNMYATCYYLYCNTRTGKVSFTKAGHHHPLFWKKNLKQYVGIKVRGIGLGIMPDVEFEAEVHDFEPGDRILLFTDGIIEQNSPTNAMYGEDRLQQQFSMLCKQDDKHMLEHIVRDLHSFSEGMQMIDDLTMLLLER